MIQVIREGYESHGPRSRSVESWSLRLTEMLRDQLLESLPAQAIEQHAERVAEKMEDPYSALAALVCLVKEKVIE